MPFFWGFGYLLQPYQLWWYLVDRFGMTAGETRYAVVTIACALSCVIIPYLIGSINPAILISRFVYHDDVRKYGSGNAGSTNMLRTYGKKAALATFLCDWGKAVAAYFFGALIWGVEGCAIAGFFVAFGHMYPVFYRFRGGKGIACLAMIALLSSPITFLILLAIFLVVFIGTKYVSLASIMSAMFYPLVLNAFIPTYDFPWTVAMAVLGATFAILRHSENIRRLWNGKETKTEFSLKRKKKDKSPSDGETK